ncbi:MAG: DUF4350 domain-containing protein [Thermoprotei archaeon]
MPQTSRLFIAGILLLSLLIILYSGVKLRGGITGDPPSLYNLGAGGVSRFFTEKLINPGVTVIYDFNALNRYSPEQYVLFIIGPDQELREASPVLEWVEKGGIMILMDETENSILLMKELGISYVMRLMRIDKAVCIIDNQTITILVNVYAVLDSNTADAVPICRIGDSTVAYMVEYGEGVFYIIGDSSIVINEVLMKSIMAENNTRLVDLLIGNRKILIYEGGRKYEYVELAIIASYIDSFLRGISVLTNTLFSPDLLWRTARVLMLAVIVSLIVIIKYGFPSPPHAVSKRSVHKEEDVRKMIERGLKKWMIEKS